jgi:branched-chain amino acid transport system permease protein
MGKVVMGIPKQRNLLYFILALLAISIVVPPVMRNDYLNTVLITIVMWAGIGAAFDLTAGYIKVTNFGFAGFFAAAAYTSALLAADFGISPFIGVFPALLVATAFGAFVAFLTLRLHGIFAAAFSWFMATTLQYVLAAEVNYTRGYEGLTVPQWFSGIATLPYYYLILAMYVVELLILFRIVRGKYGFAFKIIGEDETAARTVGTNVTFYRSMCFTVACLFAGLMGVFYAHYFAILTPDVSSLMITVQALAICYIGGRGTLWGSLPAAIVIITIFEVFRPLAEYSLIIYGALLVIVMLYAQGGLASLFIKYLKPRLMPAD